MRHYAWLTSAETDGGRSRREEIDQAGVEARLPHDDECDHILRHAVSAGLCKATAMGLEPLGWTDVMAWSMLTEPMLKKEDYEAIMLISKTYLRAYNAYNGKVLPEPWPNCFTDEERAILRDEAMAEYKAKVE